MNSMTLMIVGLLASPLIGALLCLSTDPSRGLKFAILLSSVPTIYFAFGIANPYLKISRSSCDVVKRGNNSARALRRRSPYAKR